MRRLLIAITVVLLTVHPRLQSQERPTQVPGHYLFAWTGEGGCALPPSQMQAS